MFNALDTARHADIMNPVIIDGTMYPREHGRTTVALSMAQQVTQAVWAQVWPA